MKRLILSFILTLSYRISFCQSKNYDLVNKNTNQWLHYIMSSYGTTRYSKFDLITKNDSCTIKEIIIQGDKIMFFVDSLQQAGWSKKIRFRVKKQQYLPSIELHAINYLKQDKNDSIFEFIYNVALKDRFSNITVSQRDTVYGTEKQQILEAIKNQKYSFGEIKIQKNTGIITLEIISSGLYKPFKQTEYDFDFVPIRFYYF
jgi:hypothetical protein